MHPHEQATILAFIVPRRRKRYLESLASAERRPAILDHLNHCRDLDDRFATRIPSNADVAAALRRRGAPNTCYVLSCTTGIDRQEMDLEDAIERAAMGGWGTIVSCIPGRLAYYYDECGERRMILEREGRPSRSTPSP